MGHCAGTIEALFFGVTTSEFIAKPAVSPGNRECGGDELFTAFRERGEFPQGFRLDDRRARVFLCSGESGREKEEK